MRTPIAAALVIALAACGGDGGLSLTEPNQIDFTKCMPDASADLAGRWAVDEWGCVGRASATGAMNCDPGSLPWVDGELITLTHAGIETFTLTIGGESATAQPSGNARVSADFMAGGMISIGVCTDGSAVVQFSAEPVSGNLFGDDFAAFAHRR